MIFLNSYIDNYDSILGPAFINQFIDQMSNVGVRKKKNLLRIF